MKESLAVFDLDKTLVVDNCSFAFCRYLVSKKILPFSSLLCASFYYIRHTFLGMGLVDLHNRAFSTLLKGHSLPTLETQVEPFLKEYLPLKAYFPALSQLQLAQQLGHHTLILSNSPSFLVRKIAEHLHVDEWCSTEYAIDKEKNLCHIAFMMQGEEKAFVVKKTAERLSIPVENITAYSDSFFDLPLLLSAGVPVAVNPDLKLRRFAHAHNWSIL